MLQVIKRSGQLEPFNIDKILGSLAAASDEMRQPLTAGDLRVVADKVKRRLADKETITSKDLYIRVMSVLYEEGYDKLAWVYRESINNYWKQVNGASAAAPQEAFKQSLPKN